MGIRSILRLSFVCSLILSGCVAAQQYGEVDELGCKIPPAMIYTTTDLGLSFRASVDSFVESKGRIGLGSEVVTLLSQAGNDAQIREYIQCRFEKRYNFCERQGAWLFSASALLSTNPSSQLLSQWFSDHPFPECSSVINNHSIPTFVTAQRNNRLFFDYPSPLDCNGDKVPYRFTTRWNAKVGLMMSAIYDSSQYNQVTYLKSLDNIKLVSSSIPVLDVDLEKVKISESIDWCLWFEFAQKPDSVIEFEFRAAGRNWKVVLDRLQWNSELDLDDSSSWYWTRTYVPVVLQSPDWPVFQGIRVLEIDSTLNFLCEIIIENRSNAKLEFTECKLVGADDSGVRCHHGNGLAPVQTVDVKWETGIDQADIGSVSGWTALHGEKISVKCKYRSATCSDYDDRFAANIPVSFEVPPYETRRLLLKFNQSRARTQTESDDLYDLLSSFVRIARWEFVGCLLQSNVSVFPDRLFVKSENSANGPDEANPHPSFWTWDLTAPPEGTRRKRSWEFDE